jgi:hypothetical protein
MENYILNVTEGWKIYCEMMEEAMTFLLHDPRGLALWSTMIAISLVMVIVSFIIGIKLIK